jgi:hypothetical protein
VGWEARVKMLKDTIVDCEKINEKRGDDFLKTLDILRKLGIITKEQLDNEFAIMKTSWAERNFTSSYNS